MFYPADQDPKPEKESFFSFFKFKSPHPQKDNSDSSQIDSLSSENDTNDSVNNEKKVASLTLDSIQKDSPYLFQDDIDPILTVISKEDIEKATPEALDSVLHRYDMKMDIITNALFEQVLRNYQHFVGGMQQIQDVQFELAMIAILCKNSRQSLVNTSQFMVENSLFVLSRYRKKIRIVEVMKRFIYLKKTIQKEQRIRTLCNEGDFIGAFNQYTECTNSLDSLSNLSCANDLCDRIRDGHNFILSAMEDAFIALCSKFDMNVFNNLIIAYASVNQSIDFQIIIKQSYLTSIDSVSQSLLLAHLSKDSLGDASAEFGIKNLRFKDLCGILDSFSFLNGFFALSKALSKIMLSFKRLSLALNKLIHSNEESFNIDKSFYDMEIIKRLIEYVQTDSLCHSIWDSIQQHVGFMISSYQFTTTSIKGDDFLNLIIGANTLIKIGTYFITASDDDISDGRLAPLLTSSHNNTLMNIIHRKSKEYFEAFHRESFEYLKLTMENDLWIPLPLSNDFGVESIKEFKGVGKNETPFTVYSLSDDMTIIRDFLDDKEIFVQIEGPSIDELPPSNPSTPSPSVSLGGAEIDTSSFDAPSFIISPENYDPPFYVCLSAHQVARTMGRYLHMMELLNHVVLNAFDGICELFDFYLYCVFVLFGVSYKSFFVSPELFGKEAEEAHSLASLVRSKYPTLFDSAVSIHDRMEKGKFGCGQFTNLKGFSPISLNPNVDLTSREKSFGIVERCVAVESIDLLVSVLKYCESRITSALPSPTRIRATNFQKYAADVRADLFLYHYRNLAPNLVNLSPIMEKVHKTSWDTNTLSSVHSSYIDFLIEEMKNYHQNLLKLPLIPLHVRVACWREICVFIFEELVDSYSDIKKITPEGYAQLTLDLTVLKTAFSAQASAMNVVGDVHLSLPGWSYIDSFAKAFYLLEDDLCTFVSANAFKYKLANMLCLASNGAGSSMKKKDREKFIKKIEKIYNNAQTIQLNEMKSNEKAADPPSTTF